MAFTQALELTYTCIGEVQQEVLALQTNYTQLSDPSHVDKLFQGSKYIQNSTNQSKIFPMKFETALFARYGVQILKN
jgi:hypothetical protein